MAPNAQLPPYGGRRARGRPPVLPPPPAAIATDNFTAANSPHAAANHLAPPDDALVPPRPNLPAPLRQTPRVSLRPAQPSRVDVFDLGLVQTRHRPPRRLPLKPPAPPAPGVVVKQSLRQTALRMQKIWTKIF